MSSLLNSNILVEVLTDIGSRFQSLTLGTKEKKILGASKRNAEVIAEFLS